VLARFVRRVFWLCLTCTNVVHDLGSAEPTSRVEPSSIQYVVLYWVTSLFDLTFAEPICWAKVRSKYLP